MCTSWSSTGLTRRSLMSELVTCQRALSKPKTWSDHCVHTARCAVAWWQWCVCGWNLEVGHRARDAARSRVTSSSRSVRRGRWKKTTPTATKKEISFFVAVGVFFFALRRWLWLSSSSKLISQSSPSCSSKTSASGHVVWKPIQNTDRKATYSESCCLEKAMKKGHKRLLS